MTCVRPLALDRGSIVICGLFLAVAAGLGLSADSSLGFGPDQVAYNLVAEELLTAWERGLPLYSEFGSVYRQSFAFMVAAGWRLLGDAEAAYRAILFLSACAYLMAMYVLMVNVLQDRTIAAVTTVLSVVQRYTIGTSFWGMGEFQSILPRIVVLAVVPLAWLLFEKHLRSRHVLQAFVLVGLGFALHLSALYFYGILLLTYGLYVLWTRAWSSTMNVVLATTFLFFAITVVPSPVWSHVMENSPRIAVPAALAGLVLVVFCWRPAGGRWVGRAAILYLSICSVWLMGGSSLQGVFGAGQGELERLEMDPVNLASYPVNRKSAGEVANGKVTAKGPDAAAAIPGGGPDAPGAAAGSPEEEPHAPRPPAPDEVANERDNLAALNRAIYARFGWTLFPISLATLGFALFNGGLLGAVSLYEFVHRWRRGATERERIVALYVAAVFVVSLGVTGGVQLYCRITGRPDIVLELFRAFRFIYLPMFIYLGFFLQRMWRQVAARKELRGGLLLAALAVILLVPPRQALAGLPDRLKLLVRSAVDDSRSLHGGDPSQRKYLYVLLATDAEREGARNQYRDFLELCEWVKRSTPEDSVFLTTEYSFIHHSRRDIMISYAQGAGSARSMAMVSGYRAWHEAYLAISSAFESRSPARIVAVAHEYEVDYVVAGADLPPLPAPVVYANGSFKLYRII